MEVTETPSPPPPKNKGGRPRKDPNVLFPLRKIDPKKVDSQVVIQMILDVYAQSMSLNKYTDALQATKQLGDYLGFGEVKTPQTQIVNISNPEQFHKDLSRLARAAGIPLQLEDKTEAIDVEATPVENPGGEPSGAGDRGVSEGAGGGNLRSSSSEADA